MIQADVVAARPALLKRRWQVCIMTVLLLASTLLTACGFHLRQQQNFVFDSIVISSGPDQALAEELRRAMRAAGVQVSTDSAAATAQVRLQVLTVQREQTAIGLGAAGQVRELQLRLRVGFKLDDAQGRVLIADNEVLQQRDLSYNEANALAKEAEIATLYGDMQNDIVQQIQRRLAAIKSLP